MITEGPQPTACDTSLPKDLAACHAMIRQLLDAQQKDAGRIHRLEHQLEQLLRRLYGRSAERLDPSQMVLVADLLKQLQPEGAAAPSQRPWRPGTSPLHAPKLKDCQKLLHRAANTGPTIATPPASSAACRFAWRS